MDERDTTIASLKAEAAQAAAIIAELEARYMALLRENIGAAVRGRAQIPATVKATVGKEDDDGDARE